VTRVLVLQGPNLNLLGTREPEIYGYETLDQIHAGLAEHAAILALGIDFFQSNHEGALIDRLHRRDFDVAIVNAAGLTHTSVSLRDALLGVKRPFVEVHLSDPSTREAFRHVNFLHDIAMLTIVGQGPRGYRVALDAIAERFPGAAAGAADGGAGAADGGAGATEARAGGEPHAGAGGEAEAEAGGKPGAGPPA
jgi:3-dehydroquinate dehydratase-2